MIKIKVSGQVDFKHLDNNTPVKMSIGISRSLVYDSTANQIKAGKNVLINWIWYLVENVIEYDEICPACESLLTYCRTDKNDDVNLIEIFTDIDYKCPCCEKWVVGKNCPVSQL